VAGPYIATATFNGSPSIAPVLAQFGLLNDGHDTLANPSVTRYHAVGSNRSSSAFWGWDVIVANNNVPSNQTCASGCHSIGSKSKVSNIDDPTTFDQVIPSITDDIADIVSAGVMPANASPTSVYRWVNMSAPATLGDGGEYETLVELQQLYPKFYCSNPIALQAHVVGSNTVFDTRLVSQHLNRFNLQDGLVCLNADQGNGRCNDYQTRYLCDGTWTPWRNLDTPSSSGDWELRRGFPGLCASPTAIQARYQLPPPLAIWFVINGFPDRLAEFDTNGLACNNFDQPSGGCSDYVVRFICPQ
jgi:hypothetical protein